MNVKSTIIILCCLIFISKNSLGQDLSRKDFAHKWTSNLIIDSVKVRDTLVLKKNQKYKDLYFKPDNELHEHTFYGKCGNATLRDKLLSKPPDYTKIGAWGFSSSKNETWLSLSINKKVYSFFLVSHTKDKFVFVLKDIMDVKKD